MDMYVEVEQRGPRRDILVATDTQLQEAILGSSEKSPAALTAAQESPRE